MNRFVAILEADHECCNEASVIDTSLPSKDDANKFKAICECEYFDQVEKIANALNKVSMS